MDVDGMTFTDKLIRCEKCGTEFVFTVTEQREVALSGRPVVDPALCPACRKLAGMTGRRRGRVKRFFSGKGYGFITEESGEDVFFHLSDVESRGLPSQGQEVEFGITETDRGPRAVNVRFLSEEDADQAEG
jgi:CspA family cold shock protein